MRQVRQERRVRWVRQVRQARQVRQVRHISSSILDFPPPMVQGVWGGRNVWTGPDGLRPDFQLFAQNTFLRMIMSVSKLVKGALYYGKYQVSVKISAQNISLG